MALNTENLTRFFQFLKEELGNQELRKHICKFVGIFFIFENIYHLAINPSS